MDLLEILKSLADPVRIRILSVLLDGELSVNELVELTGMGQSRISRHLKILTDSGLLCCRRDGLWSFYSAVSAGDESSFLAAVSPFLSGDFISDRDNAKKIRQLRAERRSRFFDKIVPEWESLKRSAIGEVDLEGEISRRVEGFHTAADIGCGTGDIALSLALKGHSVIGIDGSLKMIESAKKRFSDQALPSDFRIGQLEHLPMRDGEADAAVVAMALHHLPEPSAAAVELYRVVKNGGVIVAADYDRHDREEMREKHHDLWLGFDKKELVRIFESAGFEILEAKTLKKKGLGVHILTAKKPLGERNEITTA